MSFLATVHALLLPSGCHLSKTGHHSVCGVIFLLAACFATPLKEPGYHGWNVVWILLPMSKEVIIQLICNEADPYQVLAEKSWVDVYKSHKNHNWYKNLQGRANKCIWSEEKVLDYIEQDMDGSQLTEVCSGYILKLL